MISGSGIIAGVKFSEVRGASLPTLKCAVPASKGAAAVPAEAIKFTKFARGLAEGDVVPGNKKAAVQLLPLPVLVVVLAALRAGNIPLPAFLAPAEALSSVRAVFRNASDAVKGARDPLDGLPPSRPLLMRLINATFPRPVLGEGALPAGRAVHVPSTASLKSHVPRKVKPVAFPCTPPMVSPKSPAIIICDAFSLLHYLK